MFRVISTTLLSVIGVFCYGATFNLRLTNVQFPSSTQMTVELQIQTTLGSFTLGGNDFSNFSTIEITHSNPGNSVGDMSLNSATTPGGYFGGASDNGSGTVTYSLTSLSPNFSVSTTWSTITTLTYNLVSGTSSSDVTTLGYSNVTIKDNNNSNQTNGTFTGVSNQQLPVSLLSFDIFKHQSTITLDWTTGSEENNEGFEVQRSYTGIDYEVIGWVNGNGNSLSPINYSFTDHSADIILEKTIFYRLKQIDFDGASSYTPTRSINLDGINTISWFPNPARESIIVNTNETAVIEVYDMAGKTVLTTNTLESNSIDVSRIEMGTYLMIIKNMNGEVISQDKLHIK